MDGRNLRTWFTSYLISLGFNFLPKAGMPPLPLLTIATGDLVPVIFAFVRPPLSVGKVRRLIRLAQWRIAAPVRAVTTRAVRPEDIDDVRGISFRPLSFSHV